MNISVSADELRKTEADERLSSFMERMKAAGRMPSDWNTARVRHFLRLFKLNARAMLNYTTAQTYPGRLVGNLARRLPWGICSSSE